MQCTHCIIHSYRKETHTEIQYNRDTDSDSDPEDSLV
jgi:hypothetical protein